MLDTIDIPLIRSDGSLYIVELKKANIPHLVYKPRSHVIVGKEIHEAAMQVANYLRSLDHKRDAIFTDFGIDCSRATGVVVIGHPSFEKEYGEKVISEALRTYNAPLNRVEVITYKELIDGAERALILAAGDRSGAEFTIADIPTPEARDDPWADAVPRAAISFDDEPPF